MQLTATGLFTCPIYLTISIVQSNIITRNGAQDYEKYRFIYPVGVHGPFGHVFTPKRESGATCGYHSHDLQHQLQQQPSITTVPVWATAHRVSWSCWRWQRWTLRLNANGCQSFGLTSMLSFCLTDFFFFFLGSLLSWQHHPTVGSLIVTTPTQHYHPACEPLLAGRDGGADRQ